MMLVSLAVLFVALATATAVTARPPADPVPAFGQFLERWSGVHEGYDAATTHLVRGWLAVVHRLARPLASAGVQPDVLTVWTVWLALVVVACAARGGPWAVAGAVLLIVSALGDALDGAVAVLTDRTSAWGYVLDSVVDRANDGLFVAAVWVVGGPAALAVGGGVAFGLLEYLRARAGNAGASHVDAITVGERPTRVICCALGLASAGLFPRRAELLAAICLGVLLALSCAGLAQLAFTVRSRLRHS